MSAPARASAGPNLKRGATWTSQREGRAEVRRMPNLTLAQCATSSSAGLSHCLSLALKYIAFVDAGYRLDTPPGRARLRRALIKPDDSRQPERVIWGRLRLTNAEVLPTAASPTNARPRKRSGFDGVSPYRKLRASVLCN